MMAPYVWPKGSAWRQVVVLVCLLLLGAGRGINVLVPIYNKDIGKKLDIYLEYELHKMYIYRFGTILNEFKIHFKINLGQCMSYS